MTQLYTQTQIERANSTDLADFLRSHGEILTQSGKEYRWNKHDSLTIRGNRWFRHSQAKGGYPVAFVMEFFDKSFPEAVRLLTGEDGEEQTASSPSTDFKLPPRAENNSAVFDYLTAERKIDANVVRRIIEKDILYEDLEHHNVVFVGTDSNAVPRFASVRSTIEKFRQDVSGSEKRFSFHVDGKNDELFVFEAPIDAMSYMSIYPNSLEKVNFLSLGGVSDKALDQYLSDHKRIRSIFLCLDNDEAGNSACEKIAGLIPSRYSVTRLQPVMKDWNEVLQNKESIENKEYCITTFTRELPEVPVDMIRMTDVKLTEVDWLWKPYIPFGKLTILQGNPGEGKTYLAMQLAAACTNRAELPNMDKLEPFNIIYQTAEDGLGDTVKPRLIEANADLNRVLVINDLDIPLTLTDERIEKAIKQNNAKLFIIDPIQAFLGADVDMNRANEVRPIFRNLARIADETGCAIILIGHLNKTQGLANTYRGLGSIDFAASVRSIIFLDKDKSDPTIRIMRHEKSSLAPPGPALAFILGDEDGFRWIGEYEEPESDKEGKTKTDNKTEQGEMLIREMLADGRTVLSQDLESAAKEIGISARTLRLSKNKIKELVAEKNSDNKWTYRLGHPAS